MSKNRRTSEGQFLTGFCSGSNHARCPGVVSGLWCTCTRCPHDMCADCKRHVAERTTDTNTCVDAEDCATYMTNRRAARAAAIRGTA